jgi:hypothetical protein
LYTNPASIADKPEERIERITCPCCASISVDPIQDLNCGYCFCRSCARSVLTEGAACPNAKCGETFQAKELSRYFKDIFDKLTITCEECSQVYLFSQTLLHRKKCSVKPTPCINNCGKMLKGLDEHLAHVSHDCEKAKVICKRCKTKSAKDVFLGHSCVLGFINQVKMDDNDSFKTALREMQNQFQGRVG